MVIATRETSTGRGDVGKQFAAGAFGLAIFAPIIGGLAEGHFLVALLSFVILMVLAALILLFDRLVQESLLLLLIFSVCLTLTTLVKK